MNLLFLSIWLKVWRIIDQLKDYELQLLIRMVLVWRITMIHQIHQTPHQMVS